MRAIDGGSGSASRRRAGGQHGLLSDSRRGVAPAGPQFVKSGPRQILYRIGDIKAWVDKNVVPNTSAYHLRERQR
jgi:hypothetical protein